MVTIKNRVSVLLPLVVGLLVLLLAGCKPPGAKALLEGKRLLDKGKTAAAIEQLQRATALIATNAHAWNYLGLAYHAANQPSDAAQAYQKALGLNPNLVEAHYNLGCLLLEQNNPAAAKGELTAYSLSRPKDISGWLKLATAQWRSRDVGGAEKSYNEVRRLDGNNAEALNGLGLVQLSRNRAQDAQSFFAAAVKADADYAPAVLNLAIIRHQYLGNRRGALQNYRDYLAIKPTPANADAVNDIVQSLEAELNPPAPKPVVVAQVPKPAPVIPTPAPAVAPTPASVVVAPRPAPVTPKPAPVVTPPVSVPVVTAPPAVVAVKTNPPLPVAQPITTSTTLVSMAPVTPVVTPAPVIAQPPVVQTPPTPVQPPIEIAIVSNIPVRASPTATTTTSTPPAVAPTPAPVVQAPKPQPPPKPIARYAYRGVSKPKAGNRTESEKFFEQGMTAQKEKRMLDALALFHSATTSDPANFQAQYNVAWTAYALKDWPDAVEAYELALAIEPDSGTARYNFALALKQANYPLDAANELERVLVKQPDDAAVHLSLANLYAQQLNSPRLARPHYLRVLELNPTHPQATQIRYWLAENTP